MAEETALDAINAALGGGDANSSASTETEDSGAGTADPGDDAGEAQAAEASAEGAEAAGEGDGDGEGDAGEGEGGAGEPGADASAERNPDGTFKKREGGDAAAKGEQPPKKAADALNDPIPKDLKTETRERIQTLVKTTKEAQAAAQTATENFNVFVNGLQAAGVTPEQYGETLSFLQLFNSGMKGNANDGGKALELVESMAERLATYLGVERAVGDPLAKHADLKDAVQKGHINAQYARELARQRNQQGFRTELHTAANQQQQQQQQAQQERETARNELNTLEQELQKSDPQYAVKKAQLVPILKPVLAQLPPSQWKGAFQQAYSQLRVAAPAAPAAGDVPKNQPMRGNKQPSGGQTRAPNSALEAVNAALAGMR